MTDYLIKASNDELMAEATQSIGLDAGVLGIELDQMAECLIAYRLAGGSAEAERIYKRRAGAYAARCSGIPPVQCHQDILRYCREKSFYGR